MAKKVLSDGKLTAIIQEASLNRSGLVSDALFPLVQTPCMFKYIDWTGAATIEAVDDAVGCNTDVHEIDPELFDYKNGSVEDHALQQPMTDCCLESCDNNFDIASKLAEGKTEQLMNRLLINKEKRAIALALDLTKYTDNDALAPGAVGAVNEGGRYNLTKANLADPNFALLKYFQPIQTNNFITGKRTVAIMSQNTLDKFTSHPNFLGAGCIVDAVTTKEKVASLLGVREIVVADAGFNNGYGSNVQMQTFWPDDKILFVASHKFLTSQDTKVAFGIGAYNKGWRVNHYVKAEKGPDSGVEMQKQAHDETPIVLTYKAATLINLT